MNTSVNFELAKSLKEKGFNEPVIKCYSSYLKNGVLTSVYNCSIPENINSNSYEITPNIYPNPPYYSAPTIAEVVMWLYEKYRIWIEVYMDDDTTFGYLISRVTNEGRVDFPLQREFTSPTDAYEVGIVQALKKV